MGNKSFLKFSATILLIFPPGILRGQETLQGGNTDAKADQALYVPLYLKIGLDEKVKLSALKPGDILEGKLTRDVYSQYQQLFPRGSIVRLTVNKLELRRRAPNDHWPWVVKAFTPRHEKYPTFQSARVILDNGRDVPLAVSFVSIGRETVVHTEAKRASRGPQSENSGVHGPDVVSLVSTGLNRMAGVRRNGRASLTAKLEASPERTEGTAETGSTQSAASRGETVTIAAGTQARVVLLEAISASRSKVGDSVRARLIEPVVYRSAKVLPEGTILQGKVVKRTPPRMLSRSGSLMLTFSMKESAHASDSEAVVATVAGVEVDDRSRMGLDGEGGMRGDRPGLGWTVLNLAATGGIAKVTDDGLQLVIEMIVSSATDVSTAGTGRIVAACVSGAFLLTRHGRDVILPRFTEMEIVFDRPVTLPAERAEIGEARGNLAGQN